MDIAPIIAESAPGRRKGDGQLNVAVAGAGINGIMCAWALLERGVEVTVFERDLPVSATSRASTKLLHGGLRYLEHWDFGLVREGLRARAWWLGQAPQHTRRVEIALPVYQTAKRNRWKLKAGLLLYEFLAGDARLGRHRWLSRQQMLDRNPCLKRERLLGGYLFEDGQMDDYALGNWALDRIVEQGAVLRNHCPILCVDTAGGVVTARGREQFDAVVNACGPWAGELLDRSSIAHQHRLDLVRGSHLLVAGRIDCGFLLESPDDGRPCFVLPYGDHTLVGTTEVRQSLDEPIVCSAGEQSYLTRLYNAWFEPGLDTEAIVTSFAGVRPLVAATGHNMNALTRESAIEVRGRLVSVFGGKWTTSRQLGEEVAAAVGTLVGIKATQT